MEKALCLVGDLSRQQVQGCADRCKALVKIDRPSQEFMSTGSCISPEPHSEHSICIETSYG